MIIESPKCRSPSKFSTPEGGLSDEEDYTPIQSRKNINMVIFDSLSSTSEAKPRHERDKLELACLQKRHTLFHQLDRTQWLALLTVPLSYTYENEKEFKKLKSLLYNREDEVLKALKKPFPQAEAASVVDLCSKIVWVIDARYPTLLTQFG